MSEDDEDDDELDDDFDLSGVAPAGAFYQAPGGLSQRLRVVRRASQRGQVDADQRAGRPKIVITSSKPQTTRNVVRGIVHRDDAQLILVDTPGLHRPRTLLGERLNDLVKTTWAEVDVVACCFPANEKIGPGDRFLVSELAKVRRTTRVAVATKTDLVDPRAARPTT